MHKTGPNPLSPYRYQKSPVPLETSEQMLQKALDSEMHGSIYDKEQTYWIEKNRKDIVVIKKEIETLKEFDKDVYTKEECDEKFVAQETGKGLSSNDFTDELKEKLESLEPLEAEQSDWAENVVTKASYVNNRTHWKGQEHVTNTLFDAYHNQYLSVEEFVERLTAEDGVEYFTPEVGVNTIELYKTDLDPLPIKIETWMENGYNNLRLTAYRSYPDTVNNGLYIGGPITPGSGLIEFIISSIFNDTHTAYDFNKEILTTGSYRFEDTGWDVDVYHKLDKAYLPDDIGVEGLTDKEIIELINEKEDNNG